MPVQITDVTLREHGQNVPSADLFEFTPESRASLAHALRDAGVRRMEVLSCVHPRVAPAMARDQLESLLHRMGPMEGVEVVTLVPNLVGYDSFLDLGLGPDGYDHTVGVFHSAMDEHNVANLGQTVQQTLDVLQRIARRCATDGVRLTSYVSAAFGYQDRGRRIDVADDLLLDQVRALFDLGSTQVTLSDLQGLADTDETTRVWDRVLNLDGGRYADQLGYHPHNTDPARAVDQVEAAYRAGVRSFDASLHATGGCVTGAPGNAPMEIVVERLEGLGVETGIGTSSLQSLTPAWL